MSLAKRKVGEQRSPELLSRRAGLARRLRRKKRLNRPIVIAAFEGWNDAGEAASTAANYLAEAFDSLVVAEIDPEEFFVFTKVRPETRLLEGEARRTIVWPTTSISMATSGEDVPDVLFVRGPEPQLHWRSYCDSLVTLAQRIGVERFITLGAYLAEVTHNRPVPINASAEDSTLVGDQRLAPSLYEGPTGIVGVLAAALTEAGVPNASIWASVPCYSLPVSPKAALALVRAATPILERSIESADLEEEAVEYERRMDELVVEDETVAAYVARIEEMEEVVGAELSSEGLAEEIERFLRGGRSS
jgi:predicted ATP-grasp superfamily ATP-dependent carboligase